MRILGLAVITSAVALNLTGCGGTWTKEAYLPTYVPFENEGIEYEGAPVPRQMSVEDTWVELIPRTREESLNQTFFVSPYSLIVRVSTSKLQFKRVTFNRAMIYVPDTQRQVELIRETQNNKLRLERGAFLYANLRLNDRIELDFEAERSLYLVLEYSFRGHSTEVHEYRREVFKFKAELVHGELTNRIYPTV